MGSLIGIRFYVNTQLRNYAVISASYNHRKPTKEYVRHCLSNKGIHCLQSQRKSLPMQCCGTFHVSLCNYVKVDHARDLSMTSVLAKSKNRGEKKQKTQHIDYNEFGEVVNVNKLISQFDKAIEGLKDDFTQHLSELAQISRKPKLIILNVSTFPQAIPDILKSLMKNQMKLNPQQDGTTIYVPIPKITKEHREILSKNAKSFYVKCCDRVREIRNKEIKAVKQKDKLAKDLIFRIESYIDILNHQYVNKAEQMLDTKQKELLGDFE